MDARLLAELGGLFVVTALTPNINFFIPVRPTILIILLVQDVHWLTIGLVASLGHIIGVLPIYGIAYKATESTMVQRWFRIRWVQKLLTALKGRTFLLIILVNISPLPDQLIGLVGGAERYPLRKYILANFVGRALFYLPLAYFASVHATKITDAWTFVTHLLTF